MNQLPANAAHLFTHECFILSDVIAAGDAMSIRQEFAAAYHRRAAPKSFAKVPRDAALKGTTRIFHGHAIGLKMIWAAIRAP